MVYHVWLSTAVHTRAALGAASPAKKKHAHTAVLLALAASKTFCSPRSCGNASKFAGSRRWRCIDSPVRVYGMHAPRSSPLKHRQQQHGTCCACCVKANPSPAHRSAAQRSTNTAPPVHNCSSTAPDVVVSYGTHAPVLMLKHPQQPDTGPAAAKAGQTERKRGSLSRRNG